MEGLLWYAYLHVFNGRIIVKRYFRYADIKEAFAS